MSNVQPAQERELPSILELIRWATANYLHGMHDCYRAPNGLTLEEQKKVAEQKAPSNPRVVGFWSGGTKGEIRARCILKVIYLIQQNLKSAVAEQLFIAAVLANPEGPALYNEIARVIEAIYQETAVQIAEYNRSLVDESRIPQVDAIIAGICQHLNSGSLWLGAEENIVKHIEGEVTAIVDLLEKSLKLKESIIKIMPKPKIASLPPDELEDPSPVIAILEAQVGDNGEIKDTKNEKANKDDEPKSVKASVT